MAKSLDKHTRKELSYLLADLSVRNNPSLKGREKVIARGLYKGAGAVKPQTKAQLLKGIKAYGGLK